MNLSIKHWPEQERPRERLIQQGAASLSDAELLAIFLRSGSRQHSAVELSRMLLQHFGGLNPILDAGLQDLSQFHGIGASKYAQLIAVKELGRRYISAHLQQGKIELSNSKILLDFLKFELLGEKQEVFAVLCLDAHLRKISFKKMFYGSLNSCEISTNQLLRHAINQHASSLVIAHNHPWGMPQPSSADVELTQRILSACQLLEIKLIDHCIVSPEGSCSLAELGLISTQQ
ncbi:DNA repair protein RadC [Acinetobacter sp. C_4_1]|uniref:RadC family protein n=1 Tax=unclassified Acinetobacter TaxID=196816 RepID=UPI0021B7C89F|nr:MULTISPECIES: DNA repair protein RadC [unclassified Acinetobacter]MCT8090906.1 DNA repair protein RadC [Acinetobacter sp. F_3_1]MCT8099301.1 DNA repair protein RadC [Acinetobacter sp. C_3_1]MCT8102346.1 DNA repair protein RadC [Acinetobacter sp. C_4_1]MCT8136114.1 DNA repair protein RadC [Acinetobacter sp. T_3_1]